MLLLELKRELEFLGSPEKAELLQSFFKTGKGEYGEGDIFYGIVVPEIRKIVKKYSDRITLEEAEKLIYDMVHEIRLAGLLILVDKYEKGDEQVKKEVYDFYLSHTTQVNNWDLVDLTSHKIVGDFLLDKDRTILYELVKSDNLWEKRIAIISCFVFIRDGDFKDAFAISEILLKDKHDLIHKAVGWMLREIGKRDGNAERKFLKKHYKKMPRTMLRYAIEKFPEDERKKWLRGEV